MATLSSTTLLLMRKSDIFVIAAWSATFFGLLEGIVLVICRGYPANVAPYKVSNDALWIAPLVDLFVFFIVAAGLLLIMQLAGKRLKGASALTIAYGVFLFLGLLAVISVPKLVHLLSAALLCLGLAVALCRKLAGVENPLTAYLRAHLLWIPMLIASAALGVSGFEWTREAAAFRRLPAAPTGAANVLVIMLDTVRYDRFTRSAGPSLTPHLDGLIAKGVRYDNAWSTTSWSLPSQVSILTGRYPHEHGADWPALALDSKYPTLGEVLGQRGYVSGAFSGNASWVTPEYMGRGFLRFDVYILEDILRRTAYGRPIERLLWEFGFHYAGRGKGAPRVNAEFLQFLDDYPNRPFFAYLCYMDVNQAFHHRRLNRGFWTAAPSDREVIEAYDRGLQKLDAQVGALFADLTKRNLLNQTLVVITSDHGESFGAQNPEDHDPAGHGTSLYAEQTKVPLFVVYPEKLPAGGKIDTNVSVRQIPQTIAGLLGMKDSPFVGQPLPLAADASDGSAAPLLMTLRYANQKVQSVVARPWQYISHGNDPTVGEELYDLIADPGAKKRLEANPTLVQPVRDLLQKLLKTGS